MKDKYILALDQGTTSSRAILFDHKGKVVNIAQRDFKQHFPKPGWVEHNPQAIWSTQLSVMTEVLAKVGVRANQIAAIGIGNQRETTIIWDKKTGEPIYRAIVWQDRRTARHSDSLKEKYGDLIQEKTGLIVDAYFSATKIRWILDNVAGAQERAEKGELCFGTVDTWLVWKLTKGNLHVTDVSNASRTMIFNINTMQWDQELLKILNIPESLLPEVRGNSEVYGNIDGSYLYEEAVPIAGMAGDQQAALFGQMCIEPGMMKTTYGTGCFLLMNTGDKVVRSENKMLSTVAWQIDGKTTFALEGGVFVGGAAIQWVRDGLKMIRESKDINGLAGSVKDNGGVYFVPALTGIGAPYWDQYARGAMFGITRGTTNAHLARATLEGIAFQVYDIVQAMQEDAGRKTQELRVDGGASSSNLLMQIQSDLFGFEVKRPQTLETTALGVAYLAGLAVGFWDSIDEIQKYWQEERSFMPELDKDSVDHMLHYWHKAVNASKNWIEE